MTNLEDEDVKTWTEFIKTNEKIGMVVGTKNGSNYVKGGEITLAINADGGTTATIQADCIDIDGLIDALRTKVMYVKDIFVTGDVNCNTVTATGDVACADVDAVDGSFSGALEVVGNIDGAAITGTSFSTSGSGSFGSLSVNGTGASWQSYEARYCTLSSSHYFNYASSSGGSPSGTVSGHIVTNYSNTTIHYLGY